MASRCYPASFHRSLFRAAACTGFVLILLSLYLSSFSARRVAFAAAETPILANPDAVCRDCHRQIYDRYRQTPMAQGSGLAKDGLDASELAAADLVHPGSGVTYRVFLREGQPYLRYSRPPTAKAGVLEGEHRLDYFVGSGRRGRTYLYNEQSLWFEAPINWYGKKQLWDMAPAYDNATAMPSSLPVDSNCLHCHAGDVQLGDGPARNHYASQPFRSAGIGCAACHGDPAAHLTKMARTKAAPGQQSSDAAILNPDKLAPRLRDSICLQCHLEGDAAVYLPGRSLQAFRPGDDLSRSVTYFIDSARAQLGGRASSQYEALLRSACKRAVGDRLTCTTCHDPHSSPAPAERVAFFRARCLACHTGDLIATKHHPEQQDCAVCHMPTRKTLDISHEQLTDHDIEAAPPVSSPAAPKSPASHTPELVVVGQTPASDRETGLAYAQLAQRGDRIAAERALRLLLKAEQAGSSDSEVLNQLGFLLQVSGSVNSAADRYLAALRRNPQDIPAAANLAVIEAAKGQTSEAVRLLEQVVHEDPSQTVAGLNLAFLQCRAGQKAEARDVVEHMLQLNPDSPLARRFRDTGVYGNQQCSLQ